MDDKEIVVNSSTVDNAVEKVSSMLEQLAQQLGVAVDHFYPVFVQQQVLQGFYSLGWAIISCLLAILFWISTYQAIKDDEEAGFGIGVVALVFTGICAGAGLDALTHLFNPEYHALMDISEFAGTFR